MDQDLTKIIAGCCRGKSKSQKALYHTFYNYGIKVCLRYAQHREEAEEMLNDGFVKVFQKIRTHYNPSLSFKAWFNKILVRTAIDYYRKRQPILFSEDISMLQVSQDTDLLDHLSAQEILSLVQSLSPAYRIVFNLYAIDGYQHPEIADLLGIAEGTSRSNLAKARQHLQTKIGQLYQEKKSSYG